MPSSENEIIVACAGSGKTTAIVRETLALGGDKVLIATFTNNNVQHLRRRFQAECGAVPANVDIMTWHRFLLSECARPYQNALYPDQRIRSMFFPEGGAISYAKEANTREFYFVNGCDIRADRISKFIIGCEDASGGLVVRRLAQAYRAVFIDEMQDIVGWDLVWCEQLLKSGIKVLMVGDPRQYIYASNHGLQWKRFRGQGVVEKIDEWVADGLCKRTDLPANHRSNQALCDVANRLWPELTPMKSQMKVTTGHDGLFALQREHIADYVRQYAPTVLRYDKNSDTCGLPAINFGVAKGIECDRVVIAPTAPIIKFMRSGDPSDAGTRERLYVAITRARHSVAVLCDGEEPTLLQPWRP